MSGDAWDLKEDDHPKQKGWVGENIPSSLHIWCRGILAVALSYHALVLCYVRSSSKTVRLDLVKQFQFPALR
jgi:hypothetical protein